MRLILGDSREELRGLEPESIDALCCDPPAGIGFMGKTWDGSRGGRQAWIAWMGGLMVDAWRALKPGAHGLVWALPRTSHWTATALENAGFEIRDIVSHIFGSGFPKSLDVSKAIDDTAGAEREVVGERNQRFGLTQATGWNETSTPRNSTIRDTAPATPDAQRWHGWGTALKPAAEHWILVRKPLAGTVAANVLRYGTGGLNIEGCRVGTEQIPTHVQPYGYQRSGVRWDKREAETYFKAGRWPPHLLLSHSPDCADRCVEGCPVRMMDEQSGHLETGRLDPHHTIRAKVSQVAKGAERERSGFQSLGDSGGASRYFPRFRYQPKPSRAEREVGCEHLPGMTRGEAVGRDPESAGAQNPRAGANRITTVRDVGGGVHNKDVPLAKNFHPTLKPLDLMRWLVRLITPPGGVVLDPFMGSGTTGCACACEGCDFVGIEQDPEYIQIARARIEYYSANRHEIENDDTPRPQAVGQGVLW